MSARAERVMADAEEIVLRELDRLEARLRSDARQCERDGQAKESSALAEFLKMRALSHDAAARLIHRTRDVFAASRVSSEERPTP